MRSGKTRGTMVMGAGQVCLDRPAPQWTPAVIELTLAVMAAPATKGRKGLRRMLRRLEGRQTKPRPPREPPGIPQVGVKGRELPPFVPAASLPCPLSLSSAFHLPALLHRWCTVDATFCRPPQIPWNSVKSRCLPEVCLSGQLG